MLLTVKDVTARLSVARPTIYKILNRDPTFPRPIYIANRVPRWREEDIQAWIDAKAQPRAA